MAVFFMVVTRREIELQQRRIFVSERHNYYLQTQQSAILSNIQDAILVIGKQDNFVKFSNDNADQIFS